MTSQVQNTNTLEGDIAAQTEVFNQLRLSGAPADELDRAKKRLGELKKALAVAKGEVGKERGKEKEKGKAKDVDEGGRMLLKTAKVSSSPNACSCQYQSPIPNARAHAHVHWGICIYVLGYKRLRPNRDVLPPPH